MDHHSPVRPLDRTLDHHPRATLGKRNFFRRPLRISVFKTGMLADMIGSMLLIFVVLAFYRLFKDVDKELAV